MRGRIAVFLCAVVVAGAWAWMIRDAWASITPDGSTYLDLSSTLEDVTVNGATNLSGGATLLINTGDYAASAAVGLIRSTDLSGIPATAEIARALLTVKVQGASKTPWSTGAVPITCSRVMQDWDEANATSTVGTASNNWASTGYNAAGAQVHLYDLGNGEVFADTLQNGGTTYNFAHYSAIFIPDHAAWAADSSAVFDVTSDVRMFVKGDWDNYGWMLQGANIGFGNGQATLHSMDATGTDNDPKLEVWYVPSSGGGGSVSSGGGSRGTTGTTAP